MTTQAEVQEKITVALPPGAGLAIERLAIQARIRPSELLQRAVSDGLRSWGLQLPESGEGGSLWS